nr:site-specific DNA-methyltransferase [Verrucomicrobiota bacterium]
YYTMFPLEFPERVLRAAGARELVADPYCGRGTTIYAARLRGLEAEARTKRLGIWQMSAAKKPATE